LVPTLQIRFRLVPTYQTELLHNAELWAPRISEMLCNSCWCPHLAGNYQPLFGQNCKTSVYSHPYSVQQTDYAVFNTNKCTCNRRGLSYMFRTLQIISRKVITKKYIWNKYCPRCAYANVK
jgi:hypothetical protein